MNTKIWLVVIITATIVSALISLAFFTPKVDTTKREWIRSNSSGTFLCNNNECVHISDVIQHIKSSREDQQ